MTARTVARAAGPTRKPPPADRRLPPDDRQLPPAALILGVASLVPFVAATAGVAFGQGPAIRVYSYIAMISYGACVLSFLGAVHCGLALRETPVSAARLAVSGLPPLLAWLSLALGERNGLLLMAASFLAVLAWDVAAARRGWAPAWYPRLRWPLTGVVLVCLMVVMQFQPA